MKKKLFGILLAATLVVAQAATAFAAGSASATTPDVQAAIDEVAAADNLSADQIATVTAQVQEAAAGDASSIAQELSMNTNIGVLDVFNATSLVVTRTLTNLPDDYVDLYALHFSIKRGVWERLGVELNGNVATVRLSDLSPVVIVADYDKGPYKSSSSSDSSSSSSAASASASATVSVESGVATSPKTGVTSDWAMWLAAAVVLLGVSGVAFRKTRA